jgi:DNA-binding winged helix-turn-helix (wHTH) protein
VPSQGVRSVYESGEWEIDLARRELRARGVPVPIGGRAFEVIEVLVQSAGELVTKSELMDRVWPRARLRSTSCVRSIGRAGRAPCHGAANIHKPCTLAT